MYISNNKTTTTKKMATTIPFKYYTVLLKLKTKFSLNPYNNKKKQYI